MATTSSTSTANFTGTISGLDTTSLIEAMLSVEKAPLTAITTKKTALTAQQAAWEQLRGLLGTFLGKVKAFSTSGVGGARSAVSSSPGVLTASALAGTVPGTYAITVGKLATSTVARSTGTIGAPVTEADKANAISSLPLAGSMTSGKVGIVVDGKIVQATIDATGTLGTALDSIAGAIQGQLVLAGDAGATVSSAIVDNKLTFTVAGATGSHAISFGAGGDTSNANSLLGMSGVAWSTGSSATVTGKSSLGVVRTTAALDAAGLTGLAGTVSGTMTINGVSIAYDTATDSLSTIVTKINSSAAGVTASLDRANDQLLLTARTGGATPISILDSNPTTGLAAALRLGVASTDGQVLGHQAEITVDGRAYTSDTNSVSSAISGVKLNLLAEGSSTVTISPDSATTSTALQGVVDAYNALADALDTITANAVNADKGPLASDSSVRDMAMAFRRAITGAVAGAGSLTTLADIGLTTGRVGSAIGTTNRLQLDTTTLMSKMDADPSSVMNLFTSVMKPLATSVDLWTRFGGAVDTAEKTIQTSMIDLAKREDEVNARIAIRQASLQAKFTAMEKMLAQMQSTTGSLTNTIAQQNKNTG
jgi:flagellar hook-associated protein 2